MNKQETTDRIWKSIPGATRLLELYRYWPSLHDATLKSLEVGYAERNICMTVDYSDHPVDPYSETHINTRITFCWHGVIEAKLGLYEHNLYGLNFSEQDGKLHTEFMDYYFGLDGYILSEGIEVTSVEQIEHPGETYEGDSPYHLTISIT